VSVSRLCGIVLSVSFRIFSHKQVIHHLPRACPLGTALAHVSRDTGSRSDIKYISGRAEAYLLDNCNVVVGMRPNWVMYGWCLMLGGV
jgi:hypothetical protein